MTKPEIVDGTGITVAVEGDTLTITCKLEEGVKSKSGESFVLASTRGNRAIMGGAAMLGLNIYRSIPDSDLTVEEMAERYKRGQEKKRLAAIAKAAKAAQTVATPEAVKA